MVHFIRDFPRFGYILMKIKTNLISRNDFTPL